MAGVDLVGDGRTRDAVRNARLDFLLVRNFAAATSSMLPGGRRRSSVDRRGSRNSFAACGADGQFCQLDGGRTIFAGAGHGAGSDFRVRQVIRSATDGAVVRRPHESHGRNRLHRMGERKFGSALRGDLPDDDRGIVGCGVFYPLAAIANQLTWVELTGIKEIHRFATTPLHLVAFFLDTTSRTRQNSPQYLHSAMGAWCFFAARRKTRGDCDSEGITDAIFAWFHRAVHQRALRSAWSLDASGRHGTDE